jgi:hypothetical protein
MSSWNLSEISSGLVIKSDHMKHASNNWQGDVSANGNTLSGVGGLQVSERSAPSTPTSDTAVLYLDSADGALKLKKDSGSVIDIEALGSGLPIGIVNTVTYSATPTFNCSLGNIQKITLTGNVTSSTASSLVAGQQIIFCIIQDSTPRTFVWPTNVYGGMTLDDTSGSTNTQTFICLDGTTLKAISPGLSS